MAAAELPSPGIQNWFYRPHTMALGLGSPAIDAGDDGTCLTFDQREVLRPQGADCDIGAYETAETLQVNTLNDSDDGYCTSLDCSLREVFQVAASEDTITIDPALAGGTSTLNDFWERARSDLVMDDWHQRMVNKLLELE